MNNEQNNPISEGVDFRSIYELYSEFQPGSEESAFASFMSDAARKLRFGFEALTNFNLPPFFYDEPSRVLPVEFQGSTLCCLSYAINYMLRSRELRRGAPVMPHSPRHIHFCELGLQYNQTPDPNLALQAIAKNGVPIYSAPQMNWLNNSFCLTAPATGISHVKSIEILKSPAQVKQHIISRGAVVAHILVDDLFFNGYVAKTVYRVQNPSRIKAHCVCLTGYNDAQGFWFGVNSFGPNWGDKGFFMLSYQGCGVLQYKALPVFSIDLK